MAKSTAAASGPAVPETKLEIILQSGLNSSYVPEHTQPALLFEGDELNLSFSENSNPMVKITLLPDGKVLIRYATLEDVIVWQLSSDK